MVLAIKEEGHRENTHAKKIVMSYTIRHTVGPFLGQPVFNWMAKDKCMELRNFEIEV